MSDEFLDKENLENSSILCDSLKNQKENLEKEFSVCKKKAERINSDDNRHKIMEKYTNISKLNRETVQKLINHICVGKKINGSKEIPIEVHWNF